MPQQSPGNRAKGCVKLRRCNKFRSYYAAQAYQTDKNKKRRMGQRLRSNPNDGQLILRYEELYGEGSSKGVLSRLTTRGLRRL